MDRLERDQVLEVEVVRVREGGVERAQSELARCSGIGFVGGDGAEGPEEVEVGFSGVRNLLVGGFNLEGCMLWCYILILTGFFGNIGDLKKQLLLIFFIRLPLCDPSIEILELRSKHFVHSIMPDHR